MYNYTMRHQWLISVPFRSLHLLIFDLELKLKIIINIDENYLIIMIIILYIYTENTINFGEKR